MTQRACSSCMWWVDPSNSFGSCRAHPPAVGPDRPSWPITHASTWCGAFRVAEAVIRQPASHPQLLQEG